MERILLIALILAVIFGVNSAFALDGNRVGNGGKGLVCGKGSSRHVQLLDFYEMSSPFSKDLKGLSREVMVDKVLENLNRLAPNVAKIYKSASEIMGQIEFKSGAALTETPDSLQLVVPGDSSCKLEQIAIRRMEADPLTKQFLFSADLWNLMKHDQQAGLLMHEIVYEHFWKLGEKDSVKARKITAYLFSEKAKQDKPDDFWRLMQLMKLPIYR